MPKKIFLHGRYVEKYFYQIMFSRHVPTLKKLGHSLLPSSFRIMLAWYFHITLVHHSGNGCKKIKKYNRQTSSVTDGRYDAATRSLPDPTV